MTDQKSTSIKDIIIAGSLASTIITLALTEDAFANSRYYQSNVHEPSVELNMDAIEAPYANDVQSAPLAPPRQTQKLVLTPPGRDMAGQTVVIDSNAAPRVSGPTPEIAPKTADNLPPITLRPPQPKLAKVDAPKAVENDPVTAGLNPIPDDAPLRIKSLPAPEPQDIAEPVVPAPAQAPIVTSNKPTRLIDTPPPTSAAAIVQPPVIETPKANIPEAVMAQSVNDTQTRQMSSIFDVIDKSVDRLAGSSGQTPAHPKPVMNAAPKAPTLAPVPALASTPAITSAPQAVPTVPKETIAADKPVREAISDALRAQKMEATKITEPMPSPVTVSEVPEPIATTAPIVSATPELTAPTFTEAPQETVEHTPEPKVIKVEKTERNGTFKQGQIVWNMPDAAKQDVVAVAPESMPKPMPESIPAPASQPELASQDIPVKVIFSNPRVETPAVEDNFETTDIAPVDLMADVAVDQSEPLSITTDAVRVRKAPTDIARTPKPLKEPVEEPVQQIVKAPMKIEDPVEIEKPIETSEPIEIAEDDFTPEVIPLTKAKDKPPTMALEPVTEQANVQPAMAQPTPSKAKPAFMPEPVAEPFAVPFRITDNDKDRVSQPMRDEMPNTMRVQASSQRFDNDLSDAVVFNTRIEPSDTAVRIAPQGLGNVKLAVDNMNARSSSMVKPVKEAPPADMLPPPMEAVKQTTEKKIAVATETVESIEPVNLNDLIPDEPAPRVETAPALPEVIVETERSAPATAPLRMASAVSGGDVSIKFDGASKELDNAAKDNLQSIVSKMVDNPDMSIQLRSYAASTDGSDSSSRRVALGRAIDVRKYLMDRNIRPTRVEVRALGDQTDRLPLDRIDVVFVK